MVKMVSLDKSAADKRAEKDAMGSRDVIDVPAEDRGLTVNLDHHHLKNMGVEDGLKTGNKVQFSGRGEVGGTSSEPDASGVVKHRATIHLHRGAMEYTDEPRDDKTAIKGDLEKSYSAVADKSLPDKKAKGPAE